MPTAITQHVNKAKSYYTRHELQFAIGFFIAGFLFDLKFVEHPDGRAVIAQQIFYLIVALSVLTHMFFEEVQPNEPTQPRTGLKRMYYDYRSPVLHFVFGTLLNMYTIFFFKSSSILVSFAFLALLITLLLINESHRFRRQGVTVKFALLAVCLHSFFSCTVPILVGHMGNWVYWSSLAVSSLPPIFLAGWIERYRSEYFGRAKRQILAPTAVVLVSFATLYFFKLTPPVPLSLPFIGVYHKVDREGDQYRLYHQRPWWKFWAHGDQTFRAQRPDVIHVAFRIFSPTRFSDKIHVRWYWKDVDKGWQREDTMPIQIVGGRNDGFRGVAQKSNYRPGEWQVQVETNDDREIGRIYFDVVTEPEGPRDFSVDVM